VIECADIGNALHRSGNQLLGVPLTSRGPDTAPDYSLAGFAEFTPALVVWG